MSEIGILGGTFDPFHNGHLAIAQKAIDAFHLSEIILLPAKVQPFKLANKMASEDDRVNMAHLIAGNNPEFIVSTIEAYSSNISYTAKTLRVLQRQYHQDKLFFILGTDSYLTLENWYKGKELLSKYAFIVGMRPGNDNKEVIDKTRYFEKNYNAEVRLMSNDLVEISSTEIKERIRNNQGIEGLVPPQIERYIYEHQLYK